MSPAVTAPPALYLRSVVLAVPDRKPLRRKDARNEVAGVVWACSGCGWESTPCRTLAATRRPPRHECTTERFEGYCDRQAAMVGLRFTHRDQEGR